jgi:hypothetical protein
MAAAAADLGVPLDIGTTFAEGLFAPLPILMNLLFVSGGTFHNN